MSYDKLKEFVIEQNKHGVKEATVRSALEEKGWNNNLISQAIDEVYVAKLKVDSTKIEDMLIGTWNNFTNNIVNYLLTTLISILLPFIPIIIFAGPIVYDVLVLNFTLTDFMDRGIMPLMILYIFVAMLITVIFSLWGKLSILIVASNEGESTALSSLRKAWKLLTGYVWINIITSALTILIAAPALFIISMVSLKLVPQEFSLLLIGASIIVIIPALLCALMLSFAPYAYVFHGARGSTAIRTSYKIVKNKFEFVITKLLLFGLIFLLASIILSTIPVIGTILKIALTPISIIFMTKLYLITEKLNKENLGSE